MKRMTMRLDLTVARIVEAELPSEFFWTSWKPRDYSYHAQILHESFRNDIDGAIFPTYGQYEACSHLIEASASHYVSQGTWLIGTTREATQSERASLRIGRPVCYVAGIQSVDLKERRAEIQNVSVHPLYRRRGLGRALVLRALFGLQRRGFRSVSLEATALNHSAVRLYTSLGFLPETIRYKEIFFDVSSNRG